MHLRLIHTLKTRAYVLLPRHSLPHKCITAAASHKERLILGIESSCDDTGIAVVSSSGRILGEALATQVDIHAAWGGVVPKLAQEAHAAAIDSCVEDALTAAGISADQLDAIAVTIGPGLSLCLRIGVLKARELAYNHQLPIIPVHHMEAHAMVARLGAAAAAAATTGDDDDGGVKFPFVCLLISGGHNLLLVVEGIGQYVQLGTTLDDALGEAYDKVARLLGLEPKPSGGAALEKLALTGDPTAQPFTVPMQRRPSCDFSYAGLKTSVRMSIEEQLGAEGSWEDADKQQLRADIAASFQAVAVKHLEERCRRGLTWAKESHPDVKHLVVAGGVACNAYIRSRLQDIAENAGLELVCPPPRLCTDNGIMVAWAGHERFDMGIMEPPPLTAAPVEGEWVDLRPRWPLTDRKDVRSIDAPRSAKKKGVFASLTELTAASLASQSTSV